VINGLHRESEITDNLAEIHGNRLRRQQAIAASTPQIKRRARPRLRPSESVRVIGLAAPEQLA
jgi:hypothetical protein